MDTRTLKTICAAIPTMDTEELWQLIRQMNDVMTVMHGELAQRKLVGESLTSAKATEHKRRIQQSAPPAVLAHHRREVVRR